MPDPPSAKEILRARGLAARAGLAPDVRARASQSVCAQLLALPEVAGAGTAIAFAPVRDEVDVLPALRALRSRGAVLLLPWVDGSVLHLAAVDDPDADLAPGWRGVREPPVAARISVAAATADVAIVPGVAFDRDGRRLGYGGGHFDRLLATLAPRTPVVAVAFAAQVLEAVPAEPHDVSVDVLVTEEGVHRPQG